MQVEIVDGDVVVDAALLAPLLRVPARDVPEMMRKQEITSLCERGIEADEGRYRLSFFYRRRCVRLKVDPTGRVLQHSTIDYGRP